MRSETYDAICPVNRWHLADGQFELRPCLIGMADIFLIERAKIERQFAEGPLVHNVLAVIGKNQSMLLLELDDLARDFILEYCEQNVVPHPEQVVTFLFDS